MALWMRMMMMMMMGSGIMNLFLVKGPFFHRWQDATRCSGLICQAAPPK